MSAFIQITMIWQFIYSLFDTTAIYFNKYERLNFITKYISCLTHQLYTKQLGQSLKSSLYSENVIIVKVIIIKHRVINSGVAWYFC